MFVKEISCKGVACHAFGGVNVRFTFRVQGYVIVVAAGAQVWSLDKAREMVARLILIASHACFDGDKAIAI